MNKRNKTIMIVSIITLILLLVVGITYAAYVNTLSGTTQKLVLGDIYMHFKESNTLTLSNAMPSITYDSTKYFEFTIDGKNTYPNNDIYYEILLNHGDNHATKTTRIKDNLLKFTLVEVKDGVETIVVDSMSYDEINKTRIWVNTIPKNTLSEVNTTYRLYMWISDETKIGNTSDVDYDMDTWNNEVYASIKVNVNGDFEEKKISSNKLTDVFKEVLLSRTNSYIEEDGIYYVSGAADDDNASTTDDIDFNYVWYSGKLWRITAINRDGSLKMITQDNITTIAYGEDYNFYTNESTSSWIYQWLNQDFLDTLYNYENIIKTDSTWNVTSGDGNISTKLAETTMVPAKIGLLNSYEYYMAFKNSSASANYLNIGYSWWLSNRCSSSSSRIRFVEYKGTPRDSDNGLPSSAANGSRPSINLKSTIVFAGGSGTKSDPYRIKGDKEDAVANTTLLNTRSSGEYVKFDGELYRIVGIENNTTKLNKVDYVRDESDVVLTKYFASSETYGLSTNTQTEDYWDYYLNNTWYNSITSSYKSMLEQGTYYLGTVRSSAINYKLAICATASNTVSTKDCTKTSTTYTGYVGLPRNGEMFSTQLGNGYSLSSDMWLITPQSSSVWRNIKYGTIDYSFLNESYGVRPSINLKSSVKITGGTGLLNSPFEISL